MTGTYEHDKDYDLIIAVMDGRDKAEEFFTVAKSKEADGSKVMGLGVGSLATKQKLKCQRCGKYNDPGNGRPYRGPSAHRYRKEWEAEQAQRGTT